MRIQVTFDMDVYKVKAPKGKKAAIKDRVEASINDVDIDPGDTDSKDKDYVEASVEVELVMWQEILGHVNGMIESLQKEKNG